VTRPRVVIVGGGFAGLAAAEALRNADADVILIDRTNHHVFQPLLYQVATAGLSPAQMQENLNRIVVRLKGAGVGVLLAGMLAPPNLGREYGAIRPAAIRLNYGMQRVRGGANAVRLIAILPWCDQESRWALWSRWKFATSLGRFFSLEGRIVRHVKIT